MSLVGSMRCDGIVFDIHNSERVAVGISENKYYVTPNRVTKINQWLWENGLDKITTAEQIQRLVGENLMGVY